MTALLLRVPCVHGKWEAHTNSLLLPGLVICHGGREPTVEEVTQWLKEHDTGGLRISWVVEDER